jgi:murein DD-endopeptidase MepM/ murein hydrolase activator NlpD
MTSRLPALVGMILLFVIATLLIALPASAAAQAPTPPSMTGRPPFRLPFDAAPSLSTWYVIQGYGNTRGAYQNRRTWYDQGQGLHFGLDFAAKCETPVVAIGDGVVEETDALAHGAGPHNLIIRHTNSLLSLYGHLYERPRLDVGQSIRAGDFIALTGDPDLTCRSRPHLHLEVRDGSYGYAFNPIPLIDADWNSLMLLGGGGFERDLDHPRQWVTATDQPVVDFGGDLLNDYEHPWPPPNW